MFDKPCSPCTPAGVVYCMRGLYAVVYQTMWTSDCCVLSASLHMFVASNIALHSLSCIRLLRTDMRFTVALHPPPSFTTPLVRVMA